MNRCPILYTDLEKGFYSENGLKKISPGLKNLELFPLTQEEQRRESMDRMTKMSIQGIQPKLSLKLDERKKRLRY